MKGVILAAGEKYEDKEGYVRGFSEEASSHWAFMKLRVLDGLLFKCFFTMEWTSSVGDIV